MSDTPIRSATPRTVTPPRTPPAATAENTPAATRAELSPEEVQSRALDAIQNQHMARQRRPGRNRRSNANGARSLVAGATRPPPPMSVPRPDAPGEMGIYVRAFHPDETFGGRFDGDDRGFRTDLSGTTSRISTGVVINGELEVEREGSYSSPSEHPILGSASGVPTMTTRVSQEGETTVLTVDADGGNPLTPDSLTPHADIHARFELTERSATELHIHTTITGDAFPAAESFIRDPSGQSLFVGVHQMTPEEDNVLRMRGDHTRPMVESDMTVIRDENGGFQAVEFDGQRYTIDQWNGKFERRPVLIEA